MPVSLHFCSASEHNGSNDARWQANEGGAAAYATSSVLVICGTKDVVKSQLSNGDLLNKFQANVDRSALALAVESAKVSDYSGGTVKTLGTSSNNGLLHVHVWLVPATASRHNSPARADCIPKMAEALPSDGKNECLKCDVIFCVPNEDAAFAQGCALSRAFPLYTRKGGVSQTPGDLAICASFWNAETNSGMDDARLLREITATAQGVREAARLVDMPCNELHTTAFLDEVRCAVAPFGESVDCRIIRGEELKEQGFGGIYGVGKAAIEPPALCILTYAPKGAGRRVCWVGKGIVYDTGGLSIKSKDGMCGMKRDMGGAAAILHAFCAVVRLGVPDIDLTAILCLAENAVGPKSARPDDIHVLYSGKTVEINNTDAEGRLVLADGVAYASKHCRPHVVLDMCTLTGAQGIATGRRHAAVVTNSEEMEDQCVAAGKRSGDLVHPLLYCPEFYTPEFASAVADMKNSVKDRANAQSSCAAQFIANNLDADYTGAWVHVDMAAPVHVGDRATGYGVALLVDLFARAKAR